jgi:RNA polymerase sigma-70 factor, ECF subfamily
MSVLAPALPASGDIAGPSSRPGGGSMVPVRSTSSDANPAAGAGLATGAESQSFASFYQREYHSVVALAYALTGRAAAAEELAQDAFLAAYRSWAKVSAYEAPGAFVRRVVANMSVSFRRRLAAEARAIARLASRPSLWASPLPSADADFWRSVRSLPRRQAQVLALRYLEDRSDGEIAQVLGCSEATVRVHLHNGRAALAVKLGIEPGRSQQHD